MEQHARLFGHQRDTAQLAAINETSLPIHKRHASVCLFHIGSFFQKLPDNDTTKKASVTYAKR